MSKKFVTIDGNTAAAHVAYAFSEIAAIYPITPSSNMGEFADEWAAQKRQNIFGQVLDVIEMQSEAGAAGAVHGALSAGAFTTTFTAAQGLLLMIPDMYKIAGEMLPSVFHVSARSLAAQSLSIFGDHQDVMAVRQTGFALMAAGTVQEVMDLALVSHLATLEAEIPFLNFFDGFRTSHEVQKVVDIDYDTMKGLLDHKFVERFRQRAMNPEHPIVKVAQQVADVYFQGRETTNKHYADLPALVQRYMDKVGAVIGRKYKLFDYVGAPDADRVIIAMGSSCDAIDETLAYLQKKGEKVGLIKVRLYRPFSAKHFVEALPASVKKIAVLDRTKEPGSLGEPLYLDVHAVLAGTGKTVIGGRYGLSSREFTPTMIKAVYDHLNGKCTHNFTVGINDDVTHLSIPIGETIDAEAEDVKRCMFWGYGSDGTVGANKDAIKIIGDNTDMYAQGYFSYDSKKSGGVTVSHLRFGKSEIHSPYLLTKADFIALHKPEYIGRYDVLGPIKEGGVFLLNSEWTNEEVFEHLTADMQKTIIDKKISFYNINAYKIAGEAGLGNRINSVMQAAFFKISGILPEDKALALIKDAIQKTYGKKGEDIVKQNWECVDRTSAALVKVNVPASITKSAPQRKLIPDTANAFAKEIIEPTMRLKGEDIPVSKMSYDGVLPVGTSCLEKRCIAVEVPRWIPENCIQCNQCSFVCPHSTIRAKQILPADTAKAPSTFKTIKSNTKNDKSLDYKIQVYIEDCIGCGVCVEACLSKKKALDMRPLGDERAAGEVENTTFFDKLPIITDGAPIEGVKGSQFLQPLFEFSGACSGCGETPYVRLITQLFGDRMIVANATGCSSIYGGTFPTVPYCTNERGEGPAWANSLFEDNAECAFGYRLAVDANRKQLKTLLDEVKGASAELGSLVAKANELWEKTDIAARDNADALKAALKKAVGSASGEMKSKLERAISLENFIIDKSIWAFGGDGWAYDIGFGGLDHVIAMGRNVNILVMDTEVYSNTGGQSSKATPIGSIAKFAFSGKKIAKKDLGLMAMTYGYVYVASVNMGADKAQLMKALLEAEAYNGPSVVIAYSPCIAHGIDMRMSQQAGKDASACGHWPLFRFNPLLASEGKSALCWDSKEPTLDFRKYLMSERRFSMLSKLDPTEAERLFVLAAEDAKRRLAQYKKFM
jgi:pyruvate-ferredoxin/flavodoxin oxidoreductase